MKDVVPISEAVAGVGKIYVGGMIGHPFRGNATKHLSFWLHRRTRSAIITFKNHHP
jgi:hypothetical protein